jgi:cell division initiation protein
MDVTPQVINEVEFHQKMRGYDPDEVDDFLERVAVAVGQLTERLHEAEGRAATTDRRALELERKVRELDERAPARDDDETETIKRTLVLAQKTADAAVKEAKDEAQRTLTEAQQNADTLVNEAQSTSQRLVSEAEIEARRTSEETRQRMADEIVALEQAREALKADHGVLERHLEEQRLRLRGAIADLQQLLDEPDRLRAAALPELSGASRAVLTGPARTETESADSDELIDLSESGASNEIGDEGDDELVERPISGGVRFSPPEASNGAPGAQGTPAEVVTADDEGDEGDEGDTDGWSRFVREEMLDQPTAAVAMPAGEDAYLVELRKAMLDESVVTGSDDRPSRSRFGRRR